MAEEATSEDFEHNIQVIPKILLSMVLAITFGALLQFLPLWLSAPLITIVDIGGKAFIRLLQMMAVPLVVTSVYRGVVNLARFSWIGELWWRFVLYLLFTSTVAIAIGLTAVHIMEPGSHAGIQIPYERPLLIENPTIIWEVFDRLIPQNPIEALTKGDFLGVIFFVLFFAYFTAWVSEEDRIRVTSLVTSLDKIMHKMIYALLLLDPIGVFCLLAKMTASITLASIAHLGNYLLTFFLALTIHLFIFLPLVFKIITRKKYFAFFKGMLPAYITACSTGSTTAALPLTIECATRRCHLHPKVVSLLLPIAAVVHMDGTAIYEGVTVLFIAQDLDIALDLWKQCSLLLAALLIGFGFSGRPGSTIAITALILERLGLPIEAVAIIVPVEKIVEMGKSMTNVVSASIVTALLSGREDKRL